MASSVRAPFLIFAALACAACAAADGSAPADGAPLDTAGEELARNALTTQQEKTALELIDGICGDTWCEGDDDFRFDALRCCTASQSCTLSFEILPRDGGAGGRGYRRSCRTRGFTGFASLVDTAPNGYESLDQDYYFALTDCISALEAKLSR
jgi:hypothetical protein